MKKHLILLLIILLSMLCDSRIQTCSAVNLYPINMSVVAGSQVLDKDIKEIVAGIRGLAAKYNMTKEEAINRRDFSSKEKKDDSWFITLRDIQADVDAVLIFYDYKKSIAAVTLSDKKGNTKYIYYYDNGDISQYMESKNGKIHGVNVMFYRDGSLKGFGEFNEGKYLGREMRWDKSGNLQESVKNDGTREFKIKP